MKSINTKFLVVVIFIFIFSVMMITSISYAASFTATSSNTNIKVGDTVTITVKADNAAGMYKINVDDPDSILTISSGEISEFIENESTQIVFKANKAGVAKITASPEDMTDTENSNNAVKTGSKTFTINVTEKTTSSNNSSNEGNSSTTKSSDATLRTLGVRPEDYDFDDFSENKTSYNVTVPYDVDKLDVIAVANAGNKAKISISGNKNLKVGSSNNIYVVVTAEDGTKKTYTIKVTKLAKEDEKEGNLIGDNEENNEENKETIENELKLDSLTVKNFTLNPEFSSDIYSYAIDIDMNEIDVDKLELEYSANSDNAKIEVIGNENLKEGENIITIMVSSEESDNTAIYQIVVNKINSSTEIANLDMNDNNTINKIKIIVISVFVGMIILIIGLIILIHFREKKLNEEFIDNNNKEEGTTKNNENKMFYENEKDDKEILNKINKNKGKHF